MIMTICLLTIVEFAQGQRRMEGNYLITGGLSVSKALSARSADVDTLIFGDSSYMTTSPIPFVHISDSVVYSMGGDTILDAYTAGSIRIGLNAGKLLTGSRNVILGGDGSGDSLHNARGNVFVGMGVGTMEESDYNIYIGTATAAQASSANGRNIVIGSGAAPFLSGSDTLIIDSQDNHSAPFIAGNMKTHVFTVNAVTSMTADTIHDNISTPDVSGSNLWYYGGTSNPVILTDLVNPIPGAMYIIRGTSDTETLTINSGGNFKLNGGISLVLGADDIAVFLCVTDNNYQEISRSFNQ